MSLKQVVEFVKRVGATPLKVYLVFALGHTLVKLYRHLKLWFRARALWKDLPGQKYDWTFDFLGLKLLVNFHRFYEWRKDTILVAPDADLVKTPGPYVEVVANSERAVKHMLKDDFQSFTKAAPNQDYLFSMLREFLGDSVFTVRHGKYNEELKDEHALWFRHRKTASKVFTKNQFVGLVSETIHMKGALINNLFAGSPGKTWDLQDLFFKFTFDSASRIFFGREIDTISGKMTDQYAKAYDKTHKAMVDIYLGNLVPHFLASKVLPYPFGTIGDSGDSWVMNFVRAVTKSGRDFSYWLQQVNEETARIIDETCSDPNIDSRRDLVALFIKNDPTISKKELRAIIHNFIIASRDTTAITLSWFFYEMCRNPEKQAKLIEEVDRVFGKDGVPDYDSVMDGSKMPYLMACIRETLRLYPAVPEDFKYATRDSVFPDGTVVPAGAKVTFHNFSQGKNPHLWKDPMAFNPERYLNEEGKLIDRDIKPYYQPSFQAGFRQCLGLQFALQEMGIIISMLLQNYTFTMEKEELDKITWALMVTMSLSNSPKRDSYNLWVTPHPRR